MTINKISKIVVLLFSLLLVFALTAGTSPTNAFATEVEPTDFATEALNSETDQSNQINAENNGGFWKKYGEPICIVASAFAMIALLENGICLMTTFRISNLHFFIGIVCLICAFVLAIYPFKTERAEVSQITAIVESEGTEAEVSDNEKAERLKILVEHGIPFEDAVAILNDFSEAGVN